MSTWNNNEFLKKLKARTQQQQNNKNVGYVPSEINDLNAQAYAEAFLNNSSLQSIENKETDDLLARIKQENSNSNVNNVKSTDEIINEAQATISNYEKLSNSWQRSYYQFNNGVFDFVEGLGDALIGVVGGIGGLFGADTQWAKDAISFDWSPYAANAMKFTDPVGMLTAATSGEMDKIDYWNLGKPAEYSEYLEANNVLSENDTANEWVGELEHTIGNMAPTIVIGILTGGAGSAASVAGLTAEEATKQVAIQATSKAITTGIMAASAAGQSTEEALRDNPDTTLGQAVAYGVASGAVEFASEYAFEVGGKFLGKVGSAVAGSSETGQKIVAAVTKFPNTINGTLGKQVSKTAIGQLTKQMIEEGAEEVLSDIANPLIKSIYNGKSVAENYSELRVEDLAKSFIMGAVSSAILGVPDFAKNVYYGHDYTSMKYYQTQAYDTYLDMLSLENKGQAYNEDGTMTTEYAKLYDQLNESYEDVSKLAKEMENDPKRQAKLYKAMTGGLKGRTLLTDLKSANEQFRKASESLIFDNADEKTQQAFNAFKTRIFGEMYEETQEGQNRFIERFMTQSFKDSFHIGQDETVSKYSADINNLNANLTKLSKIAEGSKKYNILEKQTADIMKQVKQDLINIDNKLSFEDKEAFVEHYLGYNRILEDLREYGFDETANIFNKTLAEQIETMENSTVKTEIEKKIFDDFITKKGLENVEVRLVKDLGEGNKAKFSFKNNTVEISSKYQDDILPLLTHEVLVHKYIENVKPDELNSLFEDIKDTTWYEESKEQLKELYGDSKAEVVANFIEEAFTEKNGKNAKLFKQLFNNKSFLNFAINVNKNINVQKAEDIRMNFVKIINNMDSKYANIVIDSLRSIGFDTEEYSKKVYKETQNNKFTKYKYNNYDNTIEALQDFRDYLQARADSETDVDIEYDLNQAIDKVDQILELTEDRFTSDVRKYVKQYVDTLIERYPLENGDEVKADVIQEQKEQKDKDQKTLVVNKTQMDTVNEAINDFVNAYSALNIKSEDIQALINKVKSPDSTLEDKLALVARIDIKEIANQLNANALEDSKNFDSLSDYSALKNQPDFKNFFKIFRNIKKLNPTENYKFDVNNFADLEIKYDKKGNPITVAAKTEVLLNKIFESSTGMYNLLLGKDGVSGILNDSNFILTENEINYLINRVSNMEALIKFNLIKPYTDFYRDYLKDEANNRIKFIDEEGNTTSTRGETEETKILRDSIETFQGISKNITSLLVGYKNKNGVKLPNLLTKLLDKSRELVYSDEAIDNGVFDQIISKYNPVKQEIKGKSVKNIGETFEYYVLDSRATYDELYKSFNNHLDLSANQSKEDFAKGHRKYIIARKNGNVFGFSFVYADKFKTREWDAKSKSLQKYRGYGISIDQVFAQGTNSLEVFDSIGIFIENQVGKGANFTSNAASLAFTFQNSIKEYNAITGKLEDYNIFPTYRLEPINPKRRVNINNSDKLTVFYAYEPDLQNSEYYFNETTKEYISKYSNARKQLDELKTIYANKSFNQSLTKNEQAASDFRKTMIQTLKESLHNIKLNTINESAREKSIKNAPIVQTKVVQLNNYQSELKLSSLENAIETLKSKNARLEELRKQQNSDNKEKIETLEKQVKESNKELNRSNKTIERLKQKELVKEATKNYRGKITLPNSLLYGQAFTYADSLKFQEKNGITVPLAVYNVPEQYDFIGDVGIQSTATAVTPDTIVPIPSMIDVEEPINQTKKVDVLGKSRQSVSSEFGIEKGDKFTTIVRKFFKNVGKTKNAIQFKILLTDQQAALKQGFIEEGMEERNAESYMKRLRAAGQVGTIEALQGQTKFAIGEDGKPYIVSDENGRIQYTRSLKNSNDVLNSLVEEKFKGQKVDFDKAREQVLRDWQTYMINQHAIDSNNATRNYFIKNLKSLDLEKISSKFTGTNINELFKETSKLMYENTKNIPTIEDVKRVVYDDFDFIKEKYLNTNDAGDEISIKRLESTLSDFIDMYHVKSVYGKSISAKSLYNSPLYKDLLKYFDSKMLGTYIDEFSEKANGGTELNESDFNKLIKKLIDNNFVTDQYRLTTIDEEAKKKYLNTVASVLDKMTEPQSTRLEAQNKIWEKEYGESLKEWVSIFRENIDNNLMKRLYYGLISEEDYNTMRSMYPNYVPLGREFVYQNTYNGVTGKDVTNGIKARSGSDLVIQPIYTQVLKMFSNVNSSCTLNDAFRKLYSMGSIGENEFIKFAEDTENVRITDTFQEIDRLSTAYLDGNRVYFTYEVNSEDEDGNPITKLKRSYALLSDDAIQGLRMTDEYNTFGFEKLFKMIRVDKAVKLFKSGVTDARPRFLFTNFFRDVQDAVFTTKNDSFDFMKELPKSLFEVNNHDSELWNLYMRNGGINITQFDGENAEEYIEYLSGITKNERSKFNPLIKVKQLNFRIEQATRFNEFKLSYQRYIKTMNQTDAIRMALADAADITTDFARGGTLSKALNRTLIPFLNAQVQGACKAVNFIIRPRTAREYASLILKFIILGLLPELFNELFNENDEDYEGLSDYVKETYWLIKIPNTTQFIRIPKGRILGTVNSFFRNCMRAIEGKEDVGDAIKQVSETFVTNLAPVDLGTGIRTIFSPVSDINKNITWYGSSIDSQSDLNKSPSERYSTKTSYISRAIGKLFNYSPNRIEYLLKQYTGVVGDILLPLASEQTLNGKQNLLLTYVESNTTVDSIKNQKYRGEFYSYREELLYAKNDGDVMSAIQYNYLTSCLDELNELEDQIDESSDEAERYTLYLTLRTAYKTAMKNAKSLAEKVKNLDIDPSDRTSVAEVYRQAFGAEQALKYYSSNVYKRAAYANRLNVKWDTYYQLYFTIKDIDTKEEAVQIINSKVSGDIMRIAMYKFLGISLTQEQKTKLATYLKSRKFTSEELEGLGLSS